MKYGYATHTSLLSMVKSLVAERTKKTQSDVSLVMLKLYPDGYGVKPRKVADSQKMLPYMHEEHRSFYENLCQHAEATSDSEYGD